MNRNKVLFVDFHGVISRNDFWTSLLDPAHPLHSRYTEIDTCLFDTHEDIATDWGRGKYTSEDMHQLIERDLEIPFTELFPIFVHDCSIIDLSVPVLQKVSELSREFIPVLITNHYDCFDRFIVPANPILSSTFTELINSSTTGIFKHDNGGEIFLRTANKYNAALADCVLVDDSVHVTTVFDALSGTSLRVSTEESVLEALRSLEVQHG